jgi:hypothetical protein
MKSSSRPRRRRGDDRAAPAETFWGGYSGVFVDLDGYPWEVAHNSHWQLDDDGNVTLPA